ncbi:hypothetical protein ARMSODRAFT_1081473 [Armillaria solidipes]|uniref:Uncharacterized protein n=1 Tax=Armillaria solidipes TaxID=1076256 RepID=A0A2H3BQT4_9AGAR|nr:hypothetical protein ARMSODRAFT_1081473 [Armillaria solidipes]
MTGTHLNWSPCTGCACPNHHLPSHDFPPDRHTLNDPNLARLTRSNDEPMEGEIATLRGMISTYEAEILDINKEESRLEQFISDMKNRISLAQQKLDALCHERNHISKAIIERKGLLHPIRRLPAEMLLRIFRSTIDFPISRSHTKGDNQWEFHPADNMLWSIERVCKRWRTGSLSFPELWSFVNVVITDSNFGEDPRGIAYVRRLGMQLARSKLHRLSLSIWNDSSHSSFNSLPPALAAVLFSISSRVECLHLYLHTIVFSKIPSLHRSMPSLRKLCLIATDGDTSNNVEELDLFHCPLLRELHVIDVPNAHPSFALPWAQITTFTSDHALYATRVPGTEPLPLLLTMQKLMALEICKLRLELQSPEVHFTGSYPLSCSNLRVLDLSSWHYQGELPIKQLVERLTLPTLTELRVSCLSGHPDRDSKETFTSIRGLLERSGPPPITIFRFDHGDMREDDLLYIVRECSTLEVIHLTDVNGDAITDQMHRLLTLGVNGTTPLVPRLHALRVSGTMSFDMQIFVDMVESRWTLTHAQSPPVQRLDEVNLCRFLHTENLDEPDEDEVERITVLSALDVYRAQGMDVTLGTKVQE